MLRSTNWAIKHLFYTYFYSIKTKSHFLSLLCDLFFFKILYKKSLNFFFKINLESVLFSVITLVKNCKILYKKYLQVEK